MRLVLWLRFLLFSTFIRSSWSLSSDGVALLALSKSLMLSNSTISTWSPSDATPCKWKGVLCDGMNHAISLNLSSSGVSGSLGPQIGLLSYLQVLDLPMNNISGSIPPELGNCSMLEELDLSQNFMSGKIPASMGNLTKLSSLALYNNSLSGAIPEGSVQELESGASVPPLQSAQWLHARLSW